jgi:hypothetical protein
MLKSFPKSVAYRFTAEIYICLRLGKQNRDTIYHPCINGKERTFDSVQSLAVCKQSICYSESKEKTSFPGGIWMEPNLHQIEL